METTTEMPLEIQTSASQKEKEDESFHRPPDRIARKGAEKRILPSPAALRPSPMVFPSPSGVITHFWAEAQPPLSLWWWTQRKEGLAGGQET